jgi:tRNA (guanine37-N1)-methyltransferase
MNFNIFTLHPDLFKSFTENSLIARGIGKGVLSVNTINWRDDFGIGGYKQVDDKPFGGGSGMVIMVDPIYQALQSSCALGGKEKGYTESKIAGNNPTFTEMVKDYPESENFLADIKEHKHTLPNNSDFEDYINKQEKTEKKSVTIMMTPRGFTVNQRCCEWIQENFDTVNILCGRYEGFDARLNDYVDLELSIGNFVTNGGEIPAQALVEGIARLVPDYITKGSSVLHDSFSSGLNSYKEQQEYIVGKKNVSKAKVESMATAKLPWQEKIFNNTEWIEKVLPYIEHPQYTKPKIWNKVSVPKVLQSGHHTKIQQWRKKWF